MIQHKEYVLEEKIFWMAKRWNQGSFEYKLIRLAFSVMVYQIWRTRNELIFQNKKWDAVCSMRRIVEKIKAIVCPWTGIERNKRNGLSIKWRIVLRLLRDN